MAFGACLQFSEVFVSMVIPELALWGGSESTKVSSRQSVWMGAPGARSR